MSKKVNTQRILGLFFILLSSCVSLSAGVEPEIKQVLPRPGVAFATGNNATAYDAVFLTAGGTPTGVPVGSYMLKGVKNKVYLDIDPALINHFFLAQFTVTVDVQITTKNEFGNPGPTHNVSFTVNYDSLTLFKYTEKNSYSFTNAYWAQASIVNISNPAAVPYIRLNNTMLIERYRALASVAPTLNVASILTNSTEIEASWSSTLGAEEYDLEWTFVDDYADHTLNTGGNYIQPYYSPYILEYTFKNNATRVTVKGNSYKIPMVGEHGYLLLRVRAIGYVGANFTHRKEGPWTSDGYGQYIQNSGGSSFVYGKDLFFFVHNPSGAGQVPVHEKTLNWQCQTVFAEEGKNKTCLVYLDGASKSRQNITRISSDEMTIADENFYDYQGRVVGTFLPAPTFENKLKFYNNFNKSNVTNLPYGESDFDLSGNMCLRSINTAASSSGAGRYYSLNNPNAGNMHYEYLPDAQGYPFTLTEYMPDGTGRVRRQGGVGPTHQIGTGHETKYYYATPDAEEIDRLFGNAVGYAAHYQKNMVIDPNGQISVSYLDLQGRVIATALAGETPGNVQTLNNAGTPDRLTVAIKINPQSDVFDQGLETTKTFVVAQQGNYDFDYSITLPRLTQTATPNWCYDCVYKLEMKLLDECGTNVLDGNPNISGVQTLERTLGKPQNTQYDVDCESGGITYKFITDPTLGSQILSVPLQVGSYTLIKTLTIDQNALDYYTEKYLEGNTQLRTFESFKQEYETSADFGQCALTCQECLTKLGNYPTYLNNRLQSIINLGTTPNASDSNIIKRSWDMLKEHCDELCNNTPFDKCSNMLLLIKSDINPGGQYAPVLENNTYGGYITTEPSTVSALRFTYQYQWQSSGDVNQRVPINYTKNGQPITVKINGEVKTPNELTPEEFVDFFDESWEDVLAQYHPEYCKYQSCVQNQSAEQYEQDMLATESYSQALTKGYLNPVNESTAPVAANLLDPYFQSGGQGTAKLQDMKNLLKEYQSLKSNDLTNCPKLSVWKLCQAFYVCNKKLCSEVNSCLTANPWGSISCQPYLDQMWRMFRAIYLAERRKIIESQLAGSCPTTSAMAGKTERFPKLSTYTGGITSNNWSDIKIDVIDKLNSECDTACMQKAAGWYEKFKNCFTATNETQRKADSALFINGLIAVCRNACDADHPMGASSYPANKTPQRVSTTFYTFAAVYKHLRDLGKMSYSPGQCDMNLLTDMPYGHNFGAKPKTPGDTPCIKNYSLIDPCIKNAPNAELKKLYYKLNPPNDTNQCEKCVQCKQLKDALLEIQSEYGMPLLDTTLGWRVAIASRLNQILNFNLDWMDYWPFMKDCSELDSLFTGSVLSNFILNYAYQPNIQQRMRRLDQLKEEAYVQTPIPPAPVVYYAATNSVPPPPTWDSTLLSACLCNKLAQRKATWDAMNPKIPPTFNQYASQLCGINLPDQFNFEATLITCQEFYNVRNKNLTLTGSSVWTNNQKNTFNNYVLRNRIYVPKNCNWDCVDTPMTEKNPFLEKGRFGNTNTPPPNYTPNTKPKFRRGVNCDSFMRILDSMQTVLMPLTDLKTILRGYLFSRKDLQIQAKLPQFIQFKNAFYSRYPNAPTDTRFAPNSKNDILAWLQKYMNCLMDNLGADAMAGACCYQPNRYARALNTMLNKLAEPIDQYGNSLVEDDWAMHPPVPEFYSSVLYNGTSKPTIRYYQNPYDLPVLEMDYSDVNNLKKTVRLTYLDNLANEAYFGDIVAFLGIQPIRLYNTCDTARYFKVKVIQKVSWGYDTTWLTGHTPSYSLMDTCDRRPQKKLCDRDYYELPWTPDTFTCQKRIAFMVNYHATRAYDEYIANVKRDFRQKYLAKCLDPLLTETFTIDKPVYEYHYTLYYYDQAGSLLQTVPPAGVVPLPNSSLAAVQTARTTGGTGVFPSHNLKTRYKYNTLNQLVWQKTPDAGESQFWYDNLGRLVISQNAKQISQNQYSYTVFDAQGRITEVGQLENVSYMPSNMNWSIAFNPTQLASFIASGIHRQVTKTYYDAQVSGFTYINQKNLREQVSGMEYFDNPALSKVSAAYYTYDIHGNVNTMVRYNDLMAQQGQGFTQVDYNFDLISGKVNRVDYQKGKADWFIHTYEYDADNRITDVYTSADNVFFDKDASYFYYLHGPLKRTELGNQKVQGLDYVYTLHGWIKGINSTTLQGYRDPGKDGMAGLPHATVARDVAAYNLGYYQGDYMAVGQNPGGTLTTSNFFTPEVSSTALDNASPNLYNGNIRHMITALKPFMYNKTANTWSSPQAMAYNYDQLNRITASRAMTGSNTQVGNTWAGAVLLPQYQENYSYDPNGNILTLNRNGDNAVNWQMDQFSYSYKAGTNQLDHVSDAIAAGNYSNDIDNQAAGNYNYDAIGNLIQDQAEQIQSIEWTVSGKISKVIRTPMSQKAHLEFGYSPDGHRIWKKATIMAGPNAGTTITYYSHDASGNQMAIYKTTSNNLMWESSPIYGSSRVGVYEAQKMLYISGILQPSTLSPGFNIAQRGMRQYEVSNHLGNVLTTISDRRSMVTTNTGVIINYEAELVSASDYYPFGVAMEKRSYSVSAKYRYGFNGKEKDSDIAGDNYDFGARIYDSRIGRWLAVDAVIKADNGVYCAFVNNPIFWVDPDGNDDFFGVDGIYIGSNNNGTSKVYVVKKKDIVVKNKIVISCTNKQLLTDYMNSLDAKEGRVLRILMRIAFHYYDGDAPFIGGARHDGSAIAYYEPNKDAIRLCYSRNDKGKYVLTKLYDDANNIRTCLDHEEEHRNKRKTQLYFDKRWINAVTGKIYEKGSLEPYSHTMAIMAEIRSKHWQKTTREYKESTVSSLVKHLNEALVNLKEEDYPFSDKINLQDLKSRANEANALLEKSSKKGGDLFKINYNEKTKKFEKTVETNVVISIKRKKKKK